MHHALGEHIPFSKKITLVPRRMTRTQLFLAYRIRPAITRRARSLLGGKIEEAPWKEMTFELDLQENTGFQQVKMRTFKIAESYE